jgi:VanZ family protein
MREEPVVLKLRQKLTVLALVLYWPALCYFTHIPIPRWVYLARVSDKSLHFLAYLVLVFLLWFSVSPHRNVSWRRATAWWVLLVVVCYGVFDELLQGCVGRMCDFTDFAANVAGIFTGLFMFMFLTFWTAMLVVTGIVVFLLTNLAIKNISELQPVTSTFFYFFAYALFTALWIRHSRFALLPSRSTLNRLTVAAAPPAAFLLVVKLSSVVLGKAFTGRNVIISALGIAAVVVAASLLSFRRGSGRKEIDRLS